MNTKTKALALLTVVTLTAIAGSLALALQATALTTNSSITPVASDSQNASTAVTSPNSNSTLPPDFMGGRCFGMIDRRPGWGPNGMCREFGPGAIQVSADFTANVTNIAKSDTDVQNLLNQGYNITVVHPAMINTTVDGNGNVVTKVSTADLTLIGNNSKAWVVVDLTQQKVTKIVTVTMTEIDK